MPHSKFAYPILSYDVYDGDTVKAVIDQGWVTTKGFSIRVDGIDTPEVRTRNKLHKAAGLCAKALVAHWMSDQVDLMFASTSRDKYAGRAVGQIYSFNDPDATLSRWLLAQEDVVKPYKGKRKLPWSDAELKRCIETCREIIPVAVNGILGGIPELALNAS